MALLALAVMTAEVALALAASVIDLNALPLAVVLSLSASVRVLRLAVKA